MISTRGRALLSSKPFLVEAHFTCATDPFDPERNPAGYVNLGTAENQLVWDLLAPRLLAPPALAEHDSHYAPMIGTPRFRAAIAAYLATVVGRPVTPDALVVGAGCSALLDHLAYVLGEPGDAVLVPAPCYAGFVGDLGARAGLVPLMVPLSSREGFALTPDALERSLGGAAALGRRVVALLLTSPHNPLGAVLERGALAAAIAWAQGRELHVIVDEIYARSVFGETPFTSALSVGATRPERLHVLFGFAKDFALSGFKVGVVHSENAEVRAALAELALFAPVSTATQVAIGTLLEDRAWVERFQAENQCRLAHASGIAMSQLAGFGVPCVPPAAGLFLWADLRRFLPEATFAGERALFERLLHGHRLNITPGGACHSPEPGWFRICYAYPEANVRTGLARLGKALTIAS